MLTAPGQESVAPEAIKSAARDFVVKPSELNRVLNAIRKALA
jgi:FixJ family two-component response regulator